MLPTEAEWEAERASWSSNNAAGAITSPPKLPLVGNRNFSNGWLDGVGANGGYWSGTVSGADARGLYFGSSTARMLAGAAFERSDSMFVVLRIDPLISAAI